MFKSHTENCTKLLATNNCVVPTCSKTIFFFTISNAHQEKLF